MPRKAYLLDSNLLVVLAVGTASMAYLGRHKKTRAYSANDFTLLARILASADVVEITPNTVTEASNLARFAEEPVRTRVSEVLRAIIGGTREIYIPSTVAATDGIFLRLGLTDAALLAAELEDHVLITSDLDLYLEASRRGREVVNFNHYLEANR